MGGCASKDKKTTKVEDDAAGLVNTSHKTVSNGVLQFNWPTIGIMSTDFLSICLFLCPPSQKIKCLSTSGSGSVSSCCAGIIANPLSTLVYYTNSYKLHIIFCSPHLKTNFNILLILYIVFSFYLKWARFFPIHSFSPQASLNMM